MTRANEKQAERVDFVHVSSASRARASSRAWNEEDLGRPENRYDDNEDELARRRSPESPLEGEQELSEDLARWARYSMQNTDAAYVEPCLQRPVRSMQTGVCKSRELCDVIGMYLRKQLFPLALCFCLSACV